MTDRVGRAYRDLTTFPPLRSVLDILFYPALRDAQQVFAELPKLLCLYCVRAIILPILTDATVLCIVLLFSVATCYMIS